jgi:glycosyltransferase involved in cell wall biosynthesis
MAGNIILTGFINQSQIPLYYAAADVFVMCSGLGETWGLSVNEAMNFGTPVVVSNVCGCGFDLVKSNENGFVFEEGNIEDLATCISKCLSFNDEKRKSVAKLNKSILKKYSYETIIHSLENCLN